MSSDWLFGTILKLKKQGQRAEEKLARCALTYRTDLQNPSAKDFFFNGKNNHLLKQFRERWGSSSTTDEHSTLFLKWLSGSGIQTLQVNQVCLSASIQQSRKKRKDRHQVKAKQ